MIAVAGEGLMDVVADGDGRLTALPGGAPYNVARIAAQLGAESTFVGRLSDDTFGAELRAQLHAAGVRVAIERPSPAPTTLALAQLDASGVAEYRFYTAGTAAADLTPDLIPAGLLERASALAFGGLGIVLEPIRDTLRELTASLPPETVVLLDPNCRPDAIEDLGAYRERLRGYLRRVDLLKVSVDDLALLSPGQDPAGAARGLLDAGPAAALITDGERPVTLLTSDDSRSVPVPSVAVLDTIGAGDSFVAAVLTWWTGRRLPRRCCGEIDLVAEAAAAAVQVSATVCRTRGANVPADFVWEAGR